MNKWYFAEENNPSNSYSDEFSDSKFTVDKWNSFVREIIQNSLDVNIDKDTPVKVSFEHKEIDTDKVPGSAELLENFELCLNELLNNQTKAMYKVARNILSKNKIHCLNSPGIFSYTKYSYDMVRMGIIMWGLTPYSNDFNLNPLQYRIKKMEEIEEKIPLQIVLPYVKRSLFPKRKRL